MKVILKKKIFKCRILKSLSSYAACDSMERVDLSCRVSFLFLYLGGREGGLLLSSYADFSAFSTEEGGRGVSKGIPENRIRECLRRI
jgi:hypothetical protein